MLLVLFATLVIGQQENKGVYGAACGIVGTDPNLRTSLESMVENQWTEVMEEWLDASSWVKRAYAVEGFYRLREKGVLLSATQLDKIATIKTSDVLISTCSGCMYIDMSVEMALEKYNFD
jgi:hypothetical protein